MKIIQILIKSTVCK